MYGLSYNDHTTNFVQPFLWSRKATKATHTLGLNCTMKLWAESLVLMSVGFAQPLPEVNANSVCDLHRLWTACPCLSWSVVAIRALTSSFWPFFTPMLHSGNSPSLMPQRAGHIAWHETIQGHSLFKKLCHKHTHTSTNPVLLVWASVRDEAREFWVAFFVNHNQRTHYLTVCPGKTWRVDLKN